MLPFSPSKLVGEVRKASRAYAWAYYMAARHIAISVSPLALKVTDDVAVHVAALDSLVTVGNARLEEPMSVASESTVVMDSGWVSDGHFICWNSMHGDTIAHPEHCPFMLTKDGQFKLYVCGPGDIEAARGVSLDDLPDEDAAACREFPAGSEPIRWRLTEYIHPDLPIKRQNDLAIFEMCLDPE